MPVDDLLRFVGGPRPFSSWWLFLGILLLLTVIVWATAIFVWTLPPARLRRIPVIRGIHAWVNRRRFLRAIRGISARYQDGNLTPAQASARISRTVRSFLYVATGVRAQYMPMADIAGGRLDAAAPVLDGLSQVQFNPEARADIVALGRWAEELIASWN
jgi:hypothetical protein